MIIKLLVLLNFGFSSKINIVDCEGRSFENDFVKMTLNNTYLLYYGNKKSLLSFLLRYRFFRKKKFFLSISMTAAIVVELLVKKKNSIKKDYAVRKAITKEYEKLDIIEMMISIMEAIIPHFKVLEDSSINYLDEYYRISSIDEFDNIIAYLFKRSLYYIENECDIECFPYDLQKIEDSIGILSQFHTFLFQNNEHNS